MSTSCIAREASTEELAALGRGGKEHSNLSWRSCRIMRAFGFPVHVQKERLLVRTSLGICLYLTVSLERIRALRK